MDLTNGVVFDTAPKHYFKFGDFDTRDYGLHLALREAFTPPEKEIKESIPYMQGSLDFSFIGGGRIYENREITYKYIIPNVKKEEANAIQTDVENRLMRLSRQILQDSYDEHFHYFGKCTGVETEDDFAYSRLIFNVTFNCYPFKVANYLEGDILFDLFNFNTDVFQVLRYEEVHTKDITIINTSSTCIAPTIIADVGGNDDPALGYYKIAVNGRSYTFQLGQTDPGRFTLKMGENRLTITFVQKEETSPPMNIEFQFYKELI